MQPDTRPIDPRSGRVVYLLTGVAGMGAIEAGLRGWYDRLDQTIADQAQGRIAAGEDAERIARWAVSARNAAKAEVRQLDLDVLRLLAEERNRSTYGDALGPSFEQLQQGRTARAVIEHAGHTNAWVNGGAALTGLLVLVWLLVCLRAILRASPAGRRARRMIGAVVALLGCWLAGKGLGALGAWAGGIVLAGAGLLLGAALGAFAGRSIGGPSAG